MRLSPYYRPELDDAERILVTAQREFNHHPSRSTPLALRVLERMQFHINVQRLNEYAQGRILRYERTFDSSTMPEFWFSIPDEQVDDAGRTAIGNTPTCEDCGKPQEHCECA